MNFFETPSDTDCSNHYLWVEKYRPQKIEDFIGNPEFISKVKSWISDKQINNLLLYGKAGGGKTTIAKIIAHSLPCDVLYINASDESRIDDIRNKVKSFAASMGYQALKVLILDEADRLSLEAMMALRNVIESFSMHTRFILTCNYHEKIIDPIKSRLQDFEIIPPSKKDIAVHLSKILKKEKVDFNNTDVVILVNNFYPDIRKIINTAQKMTLHAKLTVSEKQIIESDYKIKLLHLLKSGASLKDIRQHIANNRISDFSECYTFLYSAVDDITKTNIQCTSVILALSEYQFKDAFVVDKELNFAACMTQLLEYIK